MVETLVSIVFWLFVATVVVGITMGLEWEATSWDALSGVRSKISHWTIAIGAVILLVMGALTL